jgi:hypothetical protein
MTQRAGVKTTPALRRAFRGSRTQAGAFFLHLRTLSRCIDLVLVRFGCLAGKKFRDRIDRVDIRYRLVGADAHNPRKA